MQSPLLLAFVIAASTPVAADPPKRPNIVVLLADDQGWGDLGINGNVDVRTPHIDSLARDGARFDRFFVQPVCSPTRAEMLTGRWHPRGGVSGVSTGAERLNLDERTIADALRAAGYSTGLFGKWHNGSQYPYHPNGRGFDEFYGFTSGHWADYFDAPLDHNGTDARGAGYLPDDITSRAIAFAGKAADAGRPFFCCVTFNTPHSPMQVPDEYWNRWSKRELKSVADATDHTRAALAMCENIDDNVGRLLKALADRKLDADTIVLYFSDNGPNGPRFNGGMKGRKGATDEGGVRSPLHVRWTGRIAPGTVVAPIAGAVDLMPTLLSLAGVTVPAGKPLDGIDLSAWLLGKPVPAGLDRILFAHWAGKVSARNQRYRLDAAGRLFDMATDPGQTRDAGADHPALRDRLAAAIAAWKVDVFAKAVERPYPVGHAAFPRTVLPARDGAALGGVKRSANAPNCSYFTNWTAASDAMTWSIEVAAPGRFEAVVLYTCPAADVGSTLELTCGSSKWTGAITVAHDPPLRGRERDRSPRQGESYMKDFRPLSLGTVRLEQGRAVLTLRSPAPKGTRVADIRAVELILRP